jgi:hypothetical protein
MKKILLPVLLVILAVCAGWQTMRYSRNQLDSRVVRFNADASDLLLGLQQYKEFTGHYPAGSNLDIAKALSGQSDAKVFILAVRKSDRNDKGEIVDPWGTPTQFYMAGNSVLIRSAGPNKVWEDSSVTGGDDLYRSN